MRRVPEGEARAVHAASPVRPRGSKAALAAALLLACASVCAQTTAPAAPEAPAFDILEFEVLGNSVLSAIAIERAVYPFLGPQGGFDKVEQARERLQRTYHDAGYLTVVVDIPEQRVAEGVVRLEVVEGRLEQVRVVGSKYYSQGEIRARTPDLAEGEVPFMPGVQDQVARLSRSPDRRVTPVLKPGGAPGTVQVDLKVDDRLPLHGSLELNDRYSTNTSRLRLSGMLRYDNLWQRDHSLTLNFQVSPEKSEEVRAFSVSYLFPLPDSDRLVALYAIRSRSNVAAVGTLGVIGRGSIYGARAFLPLPAKGDFHHNLAFGIDYKDFKESVNLLGADSFNTPITYAPFALQYSGTAQDGGGLTQFNLGLNFAMRRFFGNRDAEFGDKRFKAASNYASLRGDLQRTQKLPGGWSLFARLDAQGASQPLISNEQFAAGGAESVRGYLESEVLGDIGSRGSLELRAPSLPWWSEVLQQFTPVAFYETARVQVKEPLPGQTARFSLESVGVGLRLRARNAFSASLDLAWPLRDSVVTRSGGAVGRFRLLYEF